MDNFISRLFYINLIVISDFNSILCERYIRLNSTFSLNFKLVINIACSYNNYIRGAFAEIRFILKPFGPGQVMLSWKKYVPDMGIFLCKNLYKFILGGIYEDFSGNTGFANYKRSYI